LIPAQLRPRSVELIRRPARATLFKSNVEYNPVRDESRLWSFANSDFWNFTECRCHAAEFEMLERPLVDCVEDPQQPRFGRTESTGTRLMRRLRSRLRTMFWTQPSNARKWDPIFQQGQRGIRKDIWPGADFSLKMQVFRRRRNHRGAISRVPDRLLSRIRSYAFAHYTTKKLQTQLWRSAGLGGSLNKKSRPE